MLTSKSSLYNLRSSKTEQCLTILRITEIDISITKRSPPRLIPTNPNWHHLRHLIEQIVQLRIVHAGLEIPYVQRHIAETSRSGLRLRSRRCRTRRHRNWWWIDNHCRHYRLKFHKNKKKNLVNFFFIETERIKGLKS